MKKIIFSLLLISSIVHAMELPSRNIQEKSYKGLPTALINKIKNSSFMVKENYLAVGIAGAFIVADLTYFKSGDIYFWGTTEMVIAYLHSKIIETQQETLEKITTKRLNRIQLKTEQDDLSSFFTDANLIKASLGFANIIFSSFNGVRNAEQALYRYGFTAWLTTHHFINTVYTVTNQNKIHDQIEQMKKQKKS